MPYFQTISRVILYAKNITWLLQESYMIPKECKRLAEVDFPIAEVSRHAVSEKKKNSRAGHPSALHPWWARRPLASSRAVLIALLLPDPCDLHCPDSFKKMARKILLNLDGCPIGWSKTIQSDYGLRRIILDFIADFSDWNKASKQEYVNAGRSLIGAAYGAVPPLVVDPFSGGGSIPLEASRLGCDTFASDLNPVACLILKIMLRGIPVYGPQLAEDLRSAGEEIKIKVQRELGNLYPTGADGLKPVAYMWARTVVCEAPNCGAEIPLIRSFWLSKTKNRKRALRYNVIYPRDMVPQIELEVFEPESERDVQSATIDRARATCLCCKSVLSPERVRIQLALHQGGTDTIFDEEGIRIGGALMIGVVTSRSGHKGRHYRLPANEDYQAVYEAQKRVADLIADWELNGRTTINPVPDEPLPLMSGVFNVPLYGINQWGGLFNARQKLALIIIARLISKLQGPDTLRELLACCLSLFSRVCNGNARLRPDSSVAPAFGMQALPITWSFPETVLWGGRSEHFDGAISNVIRIVEQWPSISPGEVQLVNASDHTLPDQTASIWFTDPPYYFAIPYADLSDFFYVWLKRALPNNPLTHDPFDIHNNLTPKGSELCEMAKWDSERYSHKDKNFFEDGMTKAFSEGRRILKEDGIGSVVFAHKTTEGWEALLSGIIHGGWTITGSWPIATESPSRLRARESAALATSIHLICRPRPDDASVGDWADVLRELPQRVRSWMARLEGEGIRGADLVFACIGPALEIYSRYRAVETADGRNINLSEYLEKVWEVVGRTALEQILRTSQPHSSESFSGELEEDARLTALFLWTLQNSKTSVDNADIENAHSTKKLSGFSLPYDVVRRFSQPMGIDLDAWNSSIIVQQKGVVRLLPVTERVKDLFGTEGAVSAAEWIEDETRSVIQSELFAEPNTQLERSKSRRKKRNMGSDSELEAKAATVLDRVHVAMLLHAGGQASALRKWITFEQRSGPEFLRLANALSALYPVGSQEKRLLDAMLLAVPR